MITGLSGIMPGVAVAVSGAPAGPPVYVADSGLVAVFSATTINIPYPTGHQQYDIAVVHLLAMNSLSASTFVTPTGWNLMVRQVLGTAEVAYDMVSFWRRLDGTEGGNLTVGQTATVGGSGALCGVMSIFRGCVSSGTPYEALASTGGRLPTAMTGSAMTTTGAARLLVNIYGADADTAASSTAASGWAERYDYYTTNGPDELMVMDTKALATAGSVSAETPTVTGTLDRWASISFALITN